MHLMQLNRPNSRQILIQPQQLEEKMKSAKKFSIVVYGIPECPQNTNRQARAKKELVHVIEV